MNIHLIGKNSEGNKFRQQLIKRTFMEKTQCFIKEREKEKT